MHTVKTFFPPLEQPSKAYYTSIRGQFNLLFHFAQHDCMPFNYKGYSIAVMAVEVTEL